MKALIDSKELAVGAWVRTDGEIARITSLYKHNGELVAEGKLYDDSSDICTDEIMLYPRNRANPHNDTTARKEWLGEGQNRSKCVYASPAWQRK